MNYCERFDVSLAQEKTKLVAFQSPRHSGYINHLDSLNLIKINNIPIKFNHFAEHVGVIRSNSGNMSHIEDRLAAREK